LSAAPSDLAPDPAPEASGQAAPGADSRAAILRSARRVLVKIGTGVLTTTGGRFDRPRFESLCEELGRAAQSRELVVVSSGAVALGVERLGLAARPKDIRGKQAAAAVGQSRLMRLYDDALGPRGVTVAQVLLTHADIQSRTRYLNARHALSELLSRRALPIINENDTVSVAEIRFGDNDHLAAMVTNLLQAPLLILLTVVDGLYSADPGSDPTAKLLTTVPTIDSVVTDMAGAGRSALGTGGMRSKLRAARLATASGESVLMANGALPNILDRIFAAEPVGTLFLPHGGTLSAWKRWLGFTARPKGRLVVDAGARRAVQHQGRSLLAIGVVQVAGHFHKGDVVALHDAEGTEFARGLSNYSAADAGRICGLRTEQISEVLGGLPYEEMIHRDNLVVTV
jgi:glutamate 5-kinase